MNEGRATNSQQIGEADFHRITLNMTSNAGLGCFPIPSVPPIDDARLECATFYTMQHCTAVYVEVWANGVCTSPFPFCTYGKAICDVSGSVTSGFLRKACP